MRGVSRSRTLLAASLLLASSLPAGSADARLRSLIAFDRALDGSGRSPRHRPGRRRRSRRHAGAGLRGSHLVARRHDARVRVRRRPRGQRSLCVRDGDGRDPAPDAPRRPRCVPSLVAGRFADRLDGGARGTLCDLGHGPGRGRRPQAHERPHRRASGVVAGRPRDRVLRRRLALARARATPTAPDAGASAVLTPLTSPPPRPGRPTAAGSPSRGPTAPSTSSPRIAARRAGSRAAGPGRSPGAPRGRPAAGRSRSSTSPTRRSTSPTPAPLECASWRAGATR